MYWLYLLKNQLYLIFKKKQKKPTILCLYFHFDHCLVLFFSDISSKIFIWIILVKLQLIIDCVNVLIFPHLYNPQIGAPCEPSRLLWMDSFTWSSQPWLLWHCPVSSGAWSSSERPGRTALWGGHAPHWCRQLWQYGSHGTSDLKGSKGVR